jgi:hypothetical protein
MNTDTAATDVLSGTELKLIEVDGRFMWDVVKTPPPTGTLAERLDAFAAKLDALRVESEALLGDVEAQSVTVGAAYERLTGVQKDRDKGLDLWCDMMVMRDATRSLNDLVGALGFDVTKYVRDRLREAPDKPWLCD